MNVKIVKSVRLDGVCRVKSFFGVTAFVSVIIICITESGNRGIKQGLPPTNIYIITRNHYGTISFKDDRHCCITCIAGCLA